MMSTCHGESCEWGGVYVWDQSLEKVSFEVSQSINGVVIRQQQHHSSQQR